MDDIMRPKRPAKRDVIKSVEASSSTPTAADTPTHEDVAETPAAETETVEINDIPPKSKKRWFFFKRIHLSKKQWWLVGGLIVLLISLGTWGSVVAYQHARHVAKQPAIAATKPAPAPQPTTVPSTLTGLPVALDLNKRPVTGVMIENSFDARPQSGLKDAGVVYEAIAEGGITRFLALFQEAQPDYIGPVRSARPYYLDFLVPYDASIAHVGGSPDALGQIKSQGLKDLDQFANGDSYQRISQRAAPHNVYTSMANLDKLNQSKGYTSSKFTGFPRKPDMPLAQPIARVIDLNISAALYNPHYEYNAASNTYKRSEGGKPHTDERSGTQLAPKVVVALVTSRGIASDGEHTDYTVTGSGTAIVFQDGYTVTGTWEKADRSSQFVFKDSNGSAIKFNAGQTWISLVDSASDVTFTP